jgi:hypothetical protein
LHSKAGLAAIFLVVAIGVAAFAVGIAFMTREGRRTEPHRADASAALEKKSADDSGSNKVGSAPPEPQPAEPVRSEPVPEPQPPEKKPPEGPKAPPDKVKVQDKEKDKDKAPDILPGVKFAINELSLLAPATGGKWAVDPASLPQFTPKGFAPYRPDYMSIMEFKDKDGEFPLRAAIVKTIFLLRENVNKTKMRVTLPGEVKDKQLLVLKKQVKAEQDSVAEKALVLKDLLKELEETGARHRASETKRLQVLFDYTFLRLKARVVHVIEYNYNLAQIRTDSLPQLEAGDTLYRLTPQEKVTINEPYIKQYVKDLKKGWTDMAKNFPDTPWAVLAPREQAVMLGLAWQPAAK